MPKVVHSQTGKPVLEDLTVEEIERLKAYGVDVDVPESDGPFGEGRPAEPDEVPDRLVETELDEEHHGERVPDEAEYEEMVSVAEDMLELDEEEAMEELYSVDFEQIQKVDERERSKWARLVRRLDEYGQDIPQRKRRRDSRIESFQENPIGANSNELRNRARRVIRSLKDEFRQLVTRQSPKPDTLGPQIDAHNVVRRAAGDVTVDELMEEYVEVETGDRCIGVCTDISGSMSDQLEDLKIAGGALGEVAGIIGDEFVWEAFNSGMNGLKIVTGPNEEFDWRHVDSVTTGSLTPTSAGIRDCRMLMEETSAREYIMFVVTDGLANVTEDDPNEDAEDMDAVEQARLAVEECRRDGIEVVGIGFGGLDHDDMTDMFGGSSYRMTSIDSLATDLIELYKVRMSLPA